MRLRVSINVNLPLKKDWQVRSMGGAWTTIKFKYERLGTFCFKCGAIGHTDKKCSKLFEMEDDDGQREWGNDLKPEPHRGGAATNRWLRESKVVLQNKATIINGGSENHGENSNSDTVMEANNDGVNANNEENGAIISVGRQSHYEALIIQGPNNIPRSMPRSRIVGLLNGPAQLNSTEEQIEHNDTDDTGGDLKKRKRILSGASSNNDSRVLSLEDGGDIVMLDKLANNSSGRADVLNVKNNPLYDVSFLSAGHGNQACREK
jgi:hypothetical protein